MGVYIESFFHCAKSENQGTRNKLMDGLQGVQTKAFERLAGSFADVTLMEGDRSNLVSQIRMGRCWDCFRASTRVQASYSKPTIRKILEELGRCHVFTFRATPCVSTS